MELIVHWFRIGMVLFLSLCGTLSLSGQNALISLDNAKPRLNVPDSLIYVQIVSDSLPPEAGIWTRFNQDIGNRLEKMSTIWVRLNVESVAEDSSIWWVTMPALDLIDVYQKSEHGWLHQRAGARVIGRKKIRVIGYRELAVLNLPPQSSSYVYFRFEELEKVQPRISFEFKENITFEQDSLKLSRDILVSNGIFFGILSIMMLYHLMLFFSTREWAYLYYSLYVLAVDAVIFFDGILIPTIGDPLGGLKMNFIFIWILGLISVFYYLFAQSYLKTKEFLPLWHRMIYGIIGLKVLALLFGTVYRLWTLEPEMTEYVRSFIFLIDVPFLFALSVALINHRITGRTYFIIGSLLVFVVGFLTIGFREYVPLNPFIVFLFCFLGHIMVYSLGLGNRIRKDQQAKLKAQAALNDELKKINEATARFVPYEFLRSLGRNSVLEVQLGDGIEKEVSVLFSDIRAYTSLSERMTPRENFEFLNTYLGKVGPVIQTHDGFVNQYYGDGVMALFQNQAMDAIAAAIEMQEAVNRYNEERSAQQLVPIKIGVGLHTGPLMMGIMGDSQRMEAGVVSDTVNTASRMEGLTKLYGSSLILSGATVEKIVPEARGKYPMRFLGKVLVKGRAQAMDIYDCYAADEDMVKAHKDRFKREFDQGLSHYIAGEFAAAQSVFGKILDQWDGDLASQRLFERSAELLKQTDLTNWDGVERLLSK